MVARLSLIEGMYQTRALIANAQACINLYAEKNAKDSPAPYTFYVRPGYSRLLQAPVFGLGRGAYRASNGSLFVVIGQNVYYINANWQATLLGSIALGKSIISMADNGTTILMVDGTSAGYTIDLASN